MEMIHHSLRKRGVFVRSAGFMDRALAVRKVLLDKTGTLTEGRPALSDLVLAEDLPQKFNPEYINENSNLYKDLAESFEMNWLGIDLSQSASKMLSESFVDAIPYLVMILIVAVLGSIAIVAALDLADVGVAVVAGVDGGTIRLQSMCVRRSTVVGQGAEQRPLV